MSDLLQYVADLPDFPGAQALFRSFDGGQTWEVCTRVAGQSWSAALQAVAA